MRVPDLGQSLVGAVAGNVVGGGAGPFWSKTLVEPHRPRRARWSTTGTARTEPDRVYVPGGKTIKLTEREINGLLNANTDLGKSVRIEFGRDAVNAYLVVPIKPY